MEINAQFDAESSKISGKIIFSCERYELSQEDIAEMKKKKLISYVNEDTLPRTITCQVLIFIEDAYKARVMFFDPRFVMPLEVFEDPFLNKNLIEWSQHN